MDIGSVLLAVLECVGSFHLLLGRDRPGRIKETPADRWKPPDASEVARVVGANRDAAPAGRSDP